MAIDKVLTPNYAFGPMLGCYESWKVIQVSDTTLIYLSICTLCFYTSVNEILTENDSLQSSSLPQKSLSAPSSH